MDHMGFIHHSVWICWYISFHSVWICQKFQIIYIIFNIFFFSIVSVKYLLVDGNLAYSVFLGGSVQDMERIAQILKKRLKRREKILEEQNWRRKKKKKLRLLHRVLRDSWALDQMFYFYIWPCSDNIYIYTYFKYVKIHYLVCVSMGFKILLHSFSQDFNSFVLICLNQHLRDPYLHVHSASFLQTETRFGCSSFLCFSKSKTQKRRTSKKNKKNKQSYSNTVLSLFLF